MNSSRSPALRALAPAFVAAAWAIGTLAGGCSERSDAVEGERVQARSASASRASSEPVARTPPWRSEPPAAAPAADSSSARPRDTAQGPRVRVVATAGKASSRAEAGGPAGALAVGQTFQGDARLELGRGARVELALDDHVALRIQGPAVVSLLPDAEPALLVHEGLVTVDCAPRGARTNASALWIALPAARIEIADSARLVVRARPRAASPLAVVSGHARFEPTDSAQAPTLLGAGEARCLGRRGARPWPRRFTTLEIAEQALATSDPCASEEGASRTSVTAALEAALAQVAEAEARERTLLAEHARRVAAGSGDALEVQAELARSAASLQRARQRVLALRAQLAASLLGGASTQDESVLLERAGRFAMSFARPSAGVDLPPSR